MFYLQSINIKSQPAKYYLVVGTIWKKLAPKVSSEHLVLYISHQVVFTKIYVIRPLDLLLNVVRKYTRPNYNKVVFFDCPGSVGRRDD